MRQLLAKVLFSLGLTLLLSGLALIPTGKLWADLGGGETPTTPKKCISNCANGNNTGCSQNCSEVSGSDSCQVSTDNCKDCECYNKGTNEDIVCGCREKA